MESLRTQYSPFPNKNLSQIEASDLTILATVNEGWYVEYKRQLPKPADIAKAISAFPNTYGGWLFIGVEEKDKSDTVAGSCPGIPRADMDAALQSIRASVDTHLTPCPHFECKVVWGPNDVMNLAEDYGVICIEVPTSTLAPIIHSRGVIYRRVADSSEPKVENDRHQLELLWRRREKVDAEYRTWIERNPELSDEEGDAPYLRLLLDADLCLAKGHEWDLSIDEVKEALEDQKGFVFPFESIHHSSLGIVARQTSSAFRHKNFALTWIVGGGLRCELWIPIAAFSISNPEDLMLSLGRFSNIQRFITLLKNNKAQNSRVIDLNQVFQILVAVSSIYLDLLARANIAVEEIHAKAILGSVWRTVPFINSNVILGRMEKYGLPITLTSTTMIPNGYGSQSFQPVSIFKKSSDETMAAPLCAIWLFEIVCRGLGLNGFLSDRGPIEDQAAFMELFTELMPNNPRDE